MIVVSQNSQNINLKSLSISNFQIKFNLNIYKKKKSKYRLFFLLLNIIFIYKTIYYSRDSSKRRRINNLNRIIKLQELHFIRVTRVLRLSHVLLSHTSNFVI